MNEAWARAVQAAEMPGVALWATRQDMQALNAHGHAAADGFMGTVYMALLDARVRDLPQDGVWISDVAPLLKRQSVYLTFPVNRCCGDV